MTARVPGRASLGTRLAASPLGVKLALVSAVVTALVVAVSFLALSLRVQTEVRRVFSAELEAGQSGLKQLQDQTLRLLLATGSLVSTSPTLRAALQTRAGESNAGLAPRPDLVATIQREVDGIFTDLDRDLLVVTDEEGVVLAAAGAGAPRAGVDLSRLPAVRHALNADSVTADSGFGVLRAGTVPMQVGCVPIVLGGYTIGALVLGVRLDRLMPKAGSAGARSVITAGDVVLLSTVPGLAAGSRFPVPASGSGAARMTFGGEDYVVAAVPLGFTDDGKPAALHLMRSLTGALGSIAGSLGRNFALFGVAAILLVAAGAVVVSRTTLRPLARFVAFMRSGADSGQYARFDAQRAPAEIDTLTDAYNRLIDSLGREHAQLQQRTDELAATNITLTMEVAERIKTEQALHASEDALRQSQKLEALGTLAGGVAHDFNNLLSVILGYAHITATELPAGSPQVADVRQISQAAERASGLVKQLLAFSRKQVLQPQIVDLNKILANTQTLLRRLIGEDILLEVKSEPRLLRTKADPGQIEQVVMNLVVNARDAMPRGGTVLIETANVHLDERYEHRPESIPGGPAVMLSVSDTGTGMDPATRDRIFEPFFTTKAPGKGTGLGLSTVYGIVRQSGGSITVYSEVGKGTTFRCYFPPATEAETASGIAGAASAVPPGTETIMVVEDEAQLRALIRRSLGNLGYAVLEACDGREAIDLAAAHDGPIHLLISDIVMPHMSGSVVADLLKASRPDLRVLFMSGHSDEAIERHGVLSPGSTFLQKPVLPDVLARTVREILDDGPNGNGG